MGGADRRKVDDMDKTTTDKGMSKKIKAAAGKPQKAGMEKAPDDGKKRCAWAENVCSLYREYHDTEWGTPVHDDGKLFEMLILESFQAGLSWLIILKKREAFREALDGFDPVKLAEYDENKIEELMSNEKIVRNKRKLESLAVNARAFLEMQKEFGSFQSYLWAFVDNKPVVTCENLPTQTPLSDKVAADLKKRGMRFMGSVTVYSYLQAVGVVNDHGKGCFRCSL